MKKKTKLQKLIWKIFPKSTYGIWIDAFNKGMDTGRTAEKKAVENRLIQNHVKDFGKPSLTLGYEQARNAALDRIKI